MEDLGKGHMAVQCLPWGPSYSTSERLVKIVQTPGLILMLDEGLAYRQVFMDGRPLETDPNPSWLGYSDRALGRRHPRGGELRIQ